MNIYISGISGTGMGALAELASDAGHHVFGSDLATGDITDELIGRDIDIEIGPQNGTFLQKVQDKHPLDLFIHTSSLPSDHPELTLANKLNIPTGKREKLINLIIQQKHLKLVAISGTHGKTTTTAILIWIMQNLGRPTAHLVGSTLPFAPAGQYQDGSEYLIYEADEYDRNFLSFSPWLAVIPSVSHDHVDIYPTEQDYLDAFATFRSQSGQVVENITELPGLTLPGATRRYDASLAITAAQKMTNIDTDRLTHIANQFPGVGRRFEKITDGVYSDYAHHPEEITATLEIARELIERDQYKGLVILYEPHQNTRQHAVRSSYKTVFSDTDHIFWLPTYLTREDPSLSTLTPEQLSEDIPNATPTLLDETLATKLKHLHSDGYLILLMTAGPADAWFRKVFTPHLPQ